MINKRYKKGLTLIELLIAMIVTSIVLTAVVTLAYALDTVNDATNDTSRRQAEIRFATVRISDLIRHCKLVCYASTDELAVWTSDENNDGKINIGELVYLEAGAAHDYLRICEFPSTNSTVIDLGTIDGLATNWWSAYSADVDYMILMPECSNVTFYIDDLVSQPKSRLVSITFDIVENGFVRQCQISATLRGWAGNLLDASGGNIVSDDD
ncbi:MAG: PilW family protein [Planctomycetota bacterium]|jgi:prepilin-type N-terminal cleavage/methylation domain-containing protein